MIRDVLTSVESSIRRHGIRQTLSLLWHYFIFKISSKRQYSFFCRALEHEVTLRPGTSDFSVLRQVVMNGEYDMPLKAEPAVIVDAGANIGLASLYFKRRFPRAEIYALEPDPGNYEVLAAQAKDRTGIHTFQLALWSKREMLSLVSAGVDAWGIQVRTSDTGANVEAIDLLSFMEDQRISIIDLLKIDIEGSEVELFNNDCERWLKRTRVLVIELHENLRPGCEQIFNRAIQVIRHRLERSGENMVVYNLELA